uniref:Uncharacterized protein n=1 Tax=Arundo donax TaxID=35708 RepID=A0A0A9H854_ARUDO
MWWNGDFFVLLLDNTFLPSSKLHSQYTEVGPPKIQCIKQPMFISGGKVVDVADEHLKARVDVPEQTALHLDHHGVRDAPQQRRRRGQAALHVLDHRGRPPLPLRRRGAQQFRVPPPPAPRQHHRHPHGRAHHHRRPHRRRLPHRRR